MNLEIINNNNEEEQSSCYVLDLRGSTKLIRELSFDSNQRLIEHCKFMTSIHYELQRILNSKTLNEFYFNDTGDGHVCLFWGNRHAWDCLDVAIEMQLFISKSLKSYNLKLNKLKKFKGVKLDYGIGIHTGGSIVFPEMIFNRRFAFGITINSAARLESKTKLFPKTKLLFSGNTCDFLKKQYKYTLHSKSITFSKFKIKNFKKVTNERFFLDDARVDGHIIWTINNS